VSKRFWVIIKAVEQSSSEHHYSPTASLKQSLKTLDLKKETVRWSSVKEYISIKQPLQSYCWRTPAPYARIT
jgi:hypothetical protein